MYVNWSNIFNVSERQHSNLCNDTTQTYTPSKRWISVVGIDLLMKIGDMLSWACVEQLVNFFAFEVDGQDLAD